jgi:putative endonuclease
MYFVYILECEDGSLYTGMTTDVARRVREHQAGIGAKYTRGRTPVRLVHSERYRTRSHALRRELAIKRLTRLQKHSLIGVR